MSAKKANALAGEKSPYLLQHAYNPVEWLPWGEEAFRRAREEEKPIFLSVGYSTCHWCHVMEEESFENDETARLMNAHFINVKVDREERPDVDLTYMTFVQASTGQGGWPMNVWLTPELKPFIGGTYFPPDDRQGRASFPRVIERVAELWETKREDVLKQGDDIVNALREQPAGGPGGEEEGQWEDVFSAALEQVKNSFDEEFGGFSPAPKFPRPVLLNLVFRLYERGKRGESGEQLELLKKGMRTLHAMAGGGMYDQLGGGFHRYSVDQYWHVPHFEKMLYDQAQLAISYLEGFQITGERECREVAEEIFDYVSRDMTSPEGGFYSAEDADSYLDETKTAHGEGAYYVWAWEELEAVLGNEKREMEIFCRVYGAAEGGNVRPESDPMRELTGKNVLYRKSSAEEVAGELGIEVEEVRKSLEKSRARLFDERAKRPRPHLDDKIITAWNGLMISAFARGLVVLGEERYREAAEKAAGFVRDRLVNAASGVLLRSYRGGAGTVPGFASDYAFFIQALLDLYDATFEVEWLEEAIELQEMFDAQYYDGAKGGYMSVSESDEHSILSIKEEHDGAEPAPNSVAVLNLLRLSNLTGEARWRERAGAILGAARPMLMRAPIGFPQMAVALDYVLAKPVQVVIVAGEDYTETGPAMLKVARKGFRPWQTSIVLATEADREFFGSRSAALKAMEPIEGKTAVYVCEDFTCQRPVTDVGELEKLLEE